MKNGTIFWYQKRDPKIKQKTKKKMHCNSFFFGSQRVFRGAPPCDPTLRHCPLEFNSITRSTMLGFTISGVASRRRGGRLLYEHTDWRGGLRAFIDRIINITIGSTCRRPILWAKNGLESQAPFFHAKRWCFFVFFCFPFAFQIDCAKNGVWKTERNSVQSGNFGNMKVWAWATCLGSLLG